jgi:TRAP transporter TAXI family solute receptor
MRSRPSWWGVIGMLALSLTVGCRGGPDPSEAAPRRLRMLVRNPNGISHDVFQFYASSLAGVAATMDVVAGSDVVATELQNGRAEVGFAQAGSVYTAFRSGLGESQTPFTNLRAIGVVGRSSFAIGIRSDSPVRSIGDLRNKRIGVVFERATRSYVQMILNAYGIPDEQFTLIPMTETDRVAQIDDGSLDAAVFATTAAPEFAGWNRRAGLRLLDVNEAVITKLRTRYPFMTPEIIRRDAPPGLSADVHTIAVDYVLVTRADLDADFVYQLTKGFVSQFADFARRNPRELLVDPDQVLATPIPLHAGAERFYREQEILR